MLRAARMNAIERTRSSCGKTSIVYMRTVPGRDLHDLEYDHHHGTPRSSR